MISGECRLNTGSILWVGEHIQQLGVEASYYTVSIMYICVVYYVEEVWASRLH